MKDYKIKIENVVATSQIGESIDLNKISREVPDSDYKPEEFPGLVLRTKDPKAAALIFRSGKIICTGTKSVKDANRAVRQFVKVIDSVNIPVFLSPMLRSRILLPQPIWGLT